MRTCRAKPAQFSAFITEAAYQNVVENAAAAWSAVSDVQFQLVPDLGSVDIRIGFGTLNPVQTGQVGSTSWRFDGQYFRPDTTVSIEDPSQDPLLPLPNGDFQYSGYMSDLQQIVEHELVHALGLAHNPTDPNAVMFPTATPQNNAGPDQSDIQAVRSLYGPSDLVVADTTTGQSLAGD